jgi:predicted nucleic acid-binding protein
MIYLDSNVFIYATVNTAEVGEKARTLLQRIQQGEEKAETSALTFDEVFWVVKKLNFESAIEACQALLNFPNLEIVSANKELAMSALQIIKKYRLSPRDAIHAATAMATKAETIISADEHFDKIKELKRSSL